MNYLLTILLLLMPIVAVIDGLAMAPLAAVLFLLLAWPHRRALADWRAVTPSLSQSIIIVLLLTVWPFLTTFWSIIPQVSFGTSLHNVIFMSTAFLGVFFAKRRDNSYTLSSSGSTRGSIYKIPSAHGAWMDGRVKPDHDKEEKNTIRPDCELWSLPALGIALASLVIISGQLPHGGLLSWIAVLLKHDDSYLSKDINRGLCALSVLVWPAIIALAHLRTATNNRRLGMLLPWVLLLALLSQHSLSAKTGLLAGMAMFYGMMLWPLAFRRLLIWGAPLAFIAWPLLFHLFEPTLRASIFHNLPPSSQHRVEIWHFALEKWQERPWLGWGVDSSRAIPGGLEEVMPKLVKLPLHPHNLPLHVLLEQGIIGFAIFATALGLFVRRVLPAGSQDSPMGTAAKAATMVAYLTIGMSGFGMWQGWWEATGIVAFLIAVFASNEKI